MLDKLGTGLISIALRLLKPFGLRALRLSSIAGAIDLTLDRGLAYTPLAGVRLQPLGHLSKNARR